MNQDAVKPILCLVIIKVGSPAATGIGLDAVFFPISRKVN